MRHLLQLYTLYFAGICGCSLFLLCLLCKSRDRPIACPAHFRLWTPPTVVKILRNHCWCCVRFAIIYRPTIMKWWYVLWRHCLRENRNVFRRSLKIASDGADVRWAGRSFHAAAPETENVRLSTADCRETDERHVREVRTRLHGKIRLRNEPLCVEWDIKRCTLTHSLVVHCELLVAVILP